MQYFHGWGGGVGQDSFLLPAVCPGSGQPSIYECLGGRGSHLSLREGSGAKSPLTSFQATVNQFSYCLGPPPTLILLKTLEEHLFIYLVFIAFLMVAWAGIFFISQ